MRGIGARLRAIPSWQITLGVALLLLGFLIAAQLGAEGPRIRYTTQERSPLVETVLELQRQQEELKAEILDRRGQLEELGRASQGSAALVRDLNARLEQARMAAGLVALSGTGVVFQLEDGAPPEPPDENGGDQRVTARDIRTLVEELWLAGAEAISINGERLAARSAVVDIGGSVLVNQAYLAPPYQIAAIGPRDLYAQLTESEGYGDFVRARIDTSGIVASFGEFDRIDVPAFAGAVRLEHARVEPSPTPVPVGSN